MSRGKTTKNPKVNDAQRERTLQRRIMEERARAEDTWRYTRPRNKKQKCVDYLKGKTIQLHITKRIVRGVLWGLKYGAKAYPHTPEEKYYDGIGLNRLTQIFGQIRRDKRFQYLSLGTEILRENPDTGDEEFVCCDMTTEQKRRGKKPSPTLETWKEIRQTHQATMEETTTITIENALLAEAERKRLEREDLERRKRKNNGSGEGQ